MIVFVSFWVLAALTFALRRSRSAALRRTGAEWILDTSGLLVQGLVIPALEISLLYWLMRQIAPEAKGRLALSWAPANLLNFVVIDYLYYWNHRLLHSKRLWRTHALHHTAQQADVFIASRNTLWTPLLIVYVWANGICIFLLTDPAPFLAGAAITASLDLWRHTSFSPAPGSLLHRAASLLLITPHEHIWHHSSDRADKNFGANLSIWDRVHGTYWNPVDKPSRLGIPLPLGLGRKLLFPYSGEKRGSRQ